MNRRQYKQQLTKMVDDIGDQAGAFAPEAWQEMIIHLQTQVHIQLDEYRLGRKLVKREKQEIESRMWKISQLCLRRRSEVQGWWECLRCGSEWNDVLDTGKCIVPTQEEQIEAIKKKHGLVTLDEFKAEQATAKQAE